MAGDEDDNDVEDVAEDGLVIEGYKTPLSQNQNLGKGNDKDDEPVRDDLEEDDNKNKTPGPNTTTTRINPVLDRVNNITKTVNSNEESTQEKPITPSTTRQQNIRITETTAQVTETLNTPDSSNDSSPANSPSGLKTPPIPETYTISNKTQPTENKIIGEKAETPKVSPNPERLNDSNINEIILQNSTPHNTTVKDDNNKTTTTTPSPNSVAQIIGGPEGTIVTTEITTPLESPRPKTPDLDDKGNNINNNPTQSQQQETITKTPSAKNADIDDLIGKYYKSAGEKTAEYLKATNMTGFSSYNPNTNARTYKDTSKTYGHLNPDDTTSLSKALDRRQAFLDRTKDEYKQTDERQSKNNAIDHKDKIQQRQKAVTDAGKDFHEKVFEKHENYQKLEVQEQKTINIAGVELKTKGKQIDFPPDLGEQHRNLSFVASFSFVDEKGNNMKKKDAVYFGVSYKNGKITDLMMPGGIKEETEEGPNKGNAYIEKDGKRYYAKASFATIKTLEEKTTKNRAEEIQIAKLQELEEAKIKAQEKEQQNEKYPEKPTITPTPGQPQTTPNQDQDQTGGNQTSTDQQQPQTTQNLQDQNLMGGNNQTPTDQQQTQTTPNQDQNLMGGNNQTTTGPQQTQTPPPGTETEQTTQIPPNTPPGPQQTQTPPPGTETEQTTQIPPNTPPGQQKTTPIVPPLDFSKLNTNQNIQDNKTPPRTKPEQTTQTPPNTPIGQKPSNTTPQGPLVDGNNANTTESTQDKKNRTRFWDLVDDKVTGNNKANSTPPNGLGVDNTEPAAQPTNPGSSKVITVASKTQEQDKTNETEQNNEPKKSYLKTTLSSVISSSYSKSKDPITLEGLLNSDKIDTATKIALHRTFNTKTKYDNKLLKGAKEGKIKNMQEALNNGANVNAKSSKNANTALHRAVEGGNTEMVELLLAQEKIDVNIQNKQGNTALHHAVEKNNFDMVELLLEKGARTDIKNKEEKTVHNILDEKFETLRKDRKQSNQNPDYQPLRDISNLLKPYDNSEHSIGTTNRSRSNSSEIWGFELNENNPNSYHNNRYTSMKNGNLSTNPKKFNDFEVEPDENSSRASTPPSDSGFEYDTSDEHSIDIETPRSRSNTNTTDPIETTINALQTKQNPRSGVGNRQGNNNTNLVKNAWMTPDESQNQNDSRQPSEDLSKKTTTKSTNVAERMRRNSFDFANPSSNFSPPNTPQNNNQVKRKGKGNEGKGF